MLLLCPSLNLSAVRSNDAESAGHWVECACASNEVLEAVYMGTLPLIYDARVLEGLLFARKL